MLEKNESYRLHGLRSIINQYYRYDELALVKELLEKANLSDSLVSAIKDTSSNLVKAVRAARKKNTGIDLLSEYPLSTAEGAALMCLAEALLRVPDNATIDSLIKDKLANVNWQNNKGQSDSFFVNAATWALMFMGKVLNPERAETLLSKSLYKLVQRSGEGVVRKASEKAMRIMSKQFVMGRTIHEGLTNAKKKEKLGFNCSFDMLGEGAITAIDADRYFEAYQNAIITIGEHESKKLPFISVLVFLLNYLRFILVILKPKEKEYYTSSLHACYRWLN